MIKLMVLTCSDPLVSRGLFPETAWDKPLLAMPLIVLDGIVIAHDETIFGWLVIN